MHSFLSHIDLDAVINAITIALIVLSALTAHCWQRLPVPDQDGEEKAASPTLLKVPARRPLALASLALAASIAVFAHSPSASLIVKQFLVFAAYLFLADYADIRRGFRFGEVAALASVALRWIVIIGGELNIASAPPSRTFAMVMAATMAFAAVFLMEDWRNFNKRVER